MKNTLRINAILRIAGNLNRARSAKVPLLIIALTVIIGISFTACDGDNGGDNGGSGGTFTFTDIPPKYNGQYVSLQAGNLSNPTPTLLGTGSNKSSYPQISNGTVKITMFKIANNGVGDGYTGNDTHAVVVSIMDSIPPTSMMMITYNSVTFSSGNATKSWNDADSIDED